MNFLKKLLFIPPILIAVLVFMYMTNQKKAPDTKEQGEIAIAVRVIKAKKVPVVPLVHGFGAVVPGKHWVATSQVSGEIKKVHPGLKKGAILPAGAKIVFISKVDYELAVAQAKANIRSTAAKIAELGVSKENTKAVLALEKQSLKIGEGELARQKALVKRGTVSRTAFDRETRNTVTLRKKVLDLENKLRLIPTQLEVQNEQKAVFQAQLKSAELNLERTVISLPFAARISSVNAEVAQFAQPGAVLVKADGIESAEIEAQIPVSQFFSFIKAAAGHVKPQQFDVQSLEKLAAALGINVVVKLDAGGEPITWQAKFSRISDVIDPKTRTIGIIAVVQGAYSKAALGERPPLARGMFVEVVLSAKSRQKEIVVPRLVLRNGTLMVAGKDNRLEFRKVETGLARDDLVVISSGLKEGDQVVVSEVSPAIKGMLLKPQNDKKLSQSLALQARGKRAQGGLTK